MNGFFSNQNGGVMHHQHQQHRQRQRRHHQQKHVPRVHQVRINPPPLWRQVQDPDFFTNLQQVGALPQSAASELFALFADEILTQLKEVHPEERQAFELLAAPVQVGDENETPRQRHERERHEHIRRKEKARVVRIIREAVLAKNEYKQSCALHDLGAHCLQYQNRVKG